MKRNTTDRHSESYRRAVLAEILDYGHAEAIDERKFQEQLDEWLLALDGMPARQMMLRFVLAKRNRESCGKPFDVLPLSLDEIKWNAN